MIIEPSSDKMLPTILVVDDNPANLNLLAEILELEGYRVRAALNGKLALMTVARQPPELILLDVKMPGMDGFEVCEKLKTDAATRDIPVLFISAHGDSISQLQGFDAGGYDFIEKPVRRRELLARVATHLELYRSRRELALARDRLERRVLDRTRDLEEANRRLAKAGRAKDEFVSTMSHELRTPLNAIIGFSSIMEKHENLTEQQHNMVVSTKESGKKLHQLIENVLDFAEMELDHTQLAWDSAEVPELCAEVIGKVGREVSEQRIGVGLKLDPAVTNLRCDPDRLRQMLWNLLSNAAKFTPEGGRIGLDVEGDTVAGQARLCFGIRESASPRRIFRVCSAPSSSWTADSPGPMPGPVSVWRWCTAWPICTAVAWR